jgi:ribosome-associated protein
MPIVVSSSLSIPDDIPGLSPAALERLRNLAGRRLNERGILVLDAERLRSLEQNRADAICRLVELVRKALIEPKKRRKTRPTRASREQRLATKARNASIKKLRRRGGLDY